MRGRRHPRRVPGEIPAGADAYRLLVAATAPVYHAMVLLRTDPFPDLAAEAVAAAAAAGLFSGPPAASPKCVGFSAL